MTDADAAAFGESIHALAETFREPMTALRMEGYFDALKDLSIEHVSAAVRLALRQCKFFPKPVELRELVEGDRGMLADAAWGEVLREISRVGYLGQPRFSDARILPAVQSTWGSWVRLCETLPAEGPELVGWIKQFKAVYQSLEKRAALEAGAVHPQLVAFIASEQKRIEGES